MGLVGVGLGGLGVGLGGLGVGLEVPVGVEVGPADSASTVPAMAVAMSSADAVGCPQATNSAVAIRSTGTTRRLVMGFLPLPAPVWRSLRPC